MSVNGTSPTQSRPSASTVAVDGQVAGSIRGLAARCKDGKWSSNVITPRCALAGRMEEAQNAVSRLRQLDPALRVSDLKEIIPLRRQQDFARYAEGLRKAGLPE